MDDLEALQALIESNRELRAEESSVEDQKLKLEWASLLDAWRQIDQMWISRAYNRAEGDLVKVLRQSPEESEKELDEMNATLKKHKKNVAEKKKIVEKRKAEKNKATEALNKAIAQKEEIHKKFGGKITTALSGVTKSREQRLMNAMDAQHQAVFDLSDAIEKLELAEHAASQFVNTTKNALTQHLNIEREVAGLCKQSLEQIGDRISSSAMQKEGSPEDKSTPEDDELAHAPSAQQVTHLKSKVDELEAALERRISTARSNRSQLLGMSTLIEEDEEGVKHVRDVSVMSDSLNATLDISNTSYSKRHGHGMMPSPTYEDASVPLGLSDEKIRQMQRRIAQLQKRVERERRQKEEFTRNFKKEENKMKMKIESLENELKKPSTEEFECSVPTRRDDSTTSAAGQESLSNGSLFKRPDGGGTSTPPAVPNALQTLMKEGREDIISSPDVVVEEQDSEQRSSTSSSGCSISTARNTEQLFAKSPDVRNGNNTRRAGNSTQNNGSITNGRHDGMLRRQSDTPRTPQVPSGLPVAGILKNDVRKKLMFTGNTPEDTTEGAKNLEAETGASPPRSGLEAAIPNQKGLIAGADAATGASIGTLPHALAAMEEMPSPAQEAISLEHEVVVSSGVSPAVGLLPMNTRVPVTHSGVSAMSNQGAEVDSVGQLTPAATSAKSFSARDPFGRHNISQSNSQNSQVQDGGESLREPHSRSTAGYPQRGQVHPQATDTAGYTKTFTVKCSHGSLGLTFRGLEVVEVAPQGWGEANQIRRGDMLCEGNGAKLFDFADDMILSLLRNQRPLQMVFRRHAPSEDLQLLATPSLGEDTAPSKLSSSQGTAHDESRSLDDNFAETLYADPLLEKTDVFDKYYDIRYSMTNWKTHRWKGVFLEENLLPLTLYIFGKSYFSTANENSMASKFYANNSALMDVESRKEASKSPVLAAAVTSSVQIKKEGRTKNIFSSFNMGKSKSDSPTTPTLRKVATPRKKDMSPGSSSPATTTKPMPNSPTSVGSGTIELEAQVIERPQTRVSIPLLAHDFLVYFADLNYDTHLFAENILQNLRRKCKIGMEEQSMLSSWILGSDTCDISYYANVKCCSHQGLDPLHKLLAGGVDYVSHSVSRLASQWRGIGVLCQMNGSGVGNHGNGQRKGQRFSTLFQTQDFNADTVVPWCQEDTSISHSPQHWKMFLVWVKRQLYVIQDVLEDCLTTNQQRRLRKTRIPTPRSEDNEYFERSMKNGKRNRAFDPSPRARDDGPARSRSAAGVASGKRAGFTRRGSNPHQQSPTIDSYDSDFGPRGAPIEDMRAFCSDDNEQTRHRSKESLKRAISKDRRMKGSDISQASSRSKERSREGTHRAHLMNESRKREVNEFLVAGDGKIDNPSMEERGSVGKGGDDPPSPAWNSFIDESEQLSVIDKQNCKLSLLVVNEIRSRIAGEISFSRRNQANSDISGGDLNTRANYHLHNWYYKNRALMRFLSGEPEEKVPENRDYVRRSVDQIDFEINSSGDSIDIGKSDDEEREDGHDGSRSKKTIGKQQAGVPKTRSSLKIEKDVRSAIRGLKQHICYLSTTALLMLLPDLTSQLRQHLDVTRVWYKILPSLWQLICAADGKELLSYNACEVGYNIVAISNLITASNHDLNAAQLGMRHQMNRSSSKSSRYTAKADSYKSTSQIHLENGPSNRQKGARIISLSTHSTLAGAALWNHLFFTLKFSQKHYFRVFEPNLFYGKRDLERSSLMYTATTPVFSAGYASGGGYASEGDSFRGGATNENHGMLVHDTSDVFDPESDDSDGEEDGPSNRHPGLGGLMGTQKALNTSTLIEDSGLLDTNRVIQLYDIQKNFESWLAEGSPLGDNLDELFPASVQMRVTSNSGQDSIHTGNDKEILVHGLGKASTQSAVLRMTRYTEVEDVWWISKQRLPAVQGKRGEDCTVLMQELFYECSYLRVATANFREQLVLTLKDYRRFFDPYAIPKVVELFEKTQRSVNLAHHINRLKVDAGYVSVANNEIAKREKDDIWNFTSFLVWCSGIMQSERLLLPLRSWQATSEGDFGVFEQMVSVQKFMEELAEAIQALASEIQCDEKFYARAWDVVFAPEDAATRQCHSPDSQHQISPVARKHLASKFAKFSTHIIVDAIRTQIMQILLWVSGQGDVPQRRAPWSIAAEDELPPSGGKVLFCIDALEQKTYRFRQQKDVYIAHSQIESLTTILEPLVNQSIVSRFQQFDQSVIKKCFQGDQVFKPMRPPSLLHSVAVLDMWNFLFSGFDSILNFEIPLSLCLGVFCNFLCRTLCYFADLAADQNQMDASIVFPLLSRAKLTFSDIRLPEDGGGFSSGEEPEMEGDEAAELGAALQGISPMKGTKSPNKSKLSWFNKKRGVSRDKQSVEGAPGSSLVSLGRNTNDSASGLPPTGRRPTLMRTAFSLKRKPVVPAVSSLGPDYPNLQDAAQAAQRLQMQLPSMPEIIVRVRSLTFCVAQLRILSQHFTKKKSAQQKKLDKTGRVAAITETEGNQRNTSKESLGPEQEDREAAILNDAMEKCREILVNSVQSLLGFVSGYMVHVELGKALFTSLYLTSTPASVGVVGEEESDQEDANTGGGESLRLETLLRQKWRMAIDKFFGHLGTLEMDLSGQTEALPVSDLAMINYFLPILFQAWGFVVITQMRQGRSLNYVRNYVRSVDQDIDYLVEYARSIVGRFRQKNLSKAATDLVDVSGLDEIVLAAQRLQIVLNSGCSVEDLKVLAWQFDASWQAENAPPVPTTGRQGESARDPIPSTFSTSMLPDPMAATTGSLVNGSSPADRFDHPSPAVRGEPTNTSFATNLPFSGIFGASTGGSANKDQPGAANRTSSIFRNMRVPRSRAESLARDSSKDRASDKKEKNATTGRKEKKKKKDKADHPGSSSKKRRFSRRGSVSADNRSESEESTQHQQVAKVGTTGGSYFKSFFKKH